MKSLLRIRLRQDLQVNNLANVFSHDYNFEVQKEYLEEDSRPQAQLNDHLASFVRKMEHERTLLIVYYAGHGFGKGDSRNNFKMRR